MPKVLEKRNIRELNGISPGKNIKSEKEKYLPELPVNKIYRRKITSDLKNSERN